MSQEPGTNAEIIEFAKKKGATFNMMDKIDVNGNNANDLFEYLKNEARGILGTKSVKWNFTKFLCGKDGSVKRFAPKDEPNIMIPDIEK
eukprot:Pgem_evm1s1723